MDFHKPYKKECEIHVQCRLLQDKVVLITGGGTGLGRAMGEKFLSLGAKLAITSRREEVLAKAAAEMSVGGGDVFYHPCDVRDPQQVAAMITAVEQHFGRIDVLINNAAGNLPARPSTYHRERSMRC